MVQQLKLLSIKRIFAASCSACCLLLMACPSYAEVDNGWVGTWTAAPDQIGPPLKAQTIRQVIRTSVGGKRIRIRISNQYGKEPLELGSVHLAAHARDAAIKAGSDHVVTFAGKRQVTIPLGESVLSDPVSMKVAPLQELAVSMFLPSGIIASTLHGTAMQTTYSVPEYNLTTAIDLPHPDKDDSRYFLADVEVSGAHDARAIVVIGFLMGLVRQGIRICGGPMCLPSACKPILSAHRLRSRTPVLAVIAFSMMVPIPLSVLVCWHV